MARLTTQSHNIARSERGSELAFVIDALVGEGNQGTVYLGRLAPGGAPTSRCVAIKELAAGSADLRSRLVTEAGLRFEPPPGCTNAYEHVAEPMFYGSCSVAPEERVDVLLAEYVDGPNLSDLLRDEGPLPESRAVAFAAQLAAALDVAHRNNIIHRDLHPRNVIVAGDGSRLKLTDFGMACLQTRDRFLKLGLDDAMVHYLAPEQVQDVSGIDCRTDVYALGVVFYRMVTGRVPFVGDTASALFQRIMTVHPESPREHAPSLSEPTETLILRMLAKSPADRPADMRRVLAALPMALPGWRLRAAHETPQSCPQCGEVNRVESRFCRRCGRDLSLKCGGCGNRLRTLDRFCRHCGIPVTLVSRPAVLMGLKGAFAGKRLGLERSVTTMGRHQDNDLSFAGYDRYVSRFQSRIFVDRMLHWIEGWNWVNDCITTNGTFLNGTNIDGHGRVLLRRGDKLRVGDSFFRYES